MTSQIFIVGMNGSGTTLLLDCLANHALIYGFRSETKVLPYLITTELNFGMPTNDARFERLWKDFERGINSWDWPRDLFTHALANWGGRPRSAAAIFDYVMCHLAAQNNKTFWCEKTPMHVHHIELLSREFPAAKFVHVIRDGRDCAASFHRRWRFSPIRTMYRWKTAVRAGRRAGSPLGSRYCEVFYEQFTADPSRVLQQLCQFLGVDFHPQLLTPARLRPEMTGSAKNVVSHNPRRARDYFDPRTLVKLERIGGACLREFDYKPDFTQEDIDPPRITLRLLQVRDDAQRLLDIGRDTFKLKPSARISFLKTRLASAIAQRKALLP